MGSSLFLADLLTDHEPVTPPWPGFLLASRSGFHKTSCEMPAQGRAAFRNKPRPNTDRTMSRRFGHEKLNRQEKTWREPTGCVGGEESPALWQFVLTPDHHVRLHLNQTLVRRIHKQELMDAFRREVRQMRFIVSGYKFVFSYSAKAFAEANGLTLEQATRVFNAIRNEAEERLRIVSGRVRKRIETHYERNKAGSLVEVYTLRYDELSKCLQIDTGADTRRNVDNSE